MRGLVVGLFLALGMSGSALADGSGARTAGYCAAGSSLGAAAAGLFGHQRCRALDGREDDRERFLREAAARQELHERILRQHREMGLGRPTPAVAAADEVSGAQRLLTALGHYRGPIDGIAGPETRAGVRRFEASQGLPPTGMVTTAIVQRMRAAL